MHTMTGRAGGAFFLFCAVAALSSGCGGAAMSPKAGDAFAVTSAEQPTATPTNVPDALSQLDQAEAQIGQALGQPAFAQPASPDELQKAPATSPAPTAPPPPPGAESPVDRASGGFAPADPCATACRALASMGRSAEHVCGLAGDGDERCSNARARVTRATDRVTAQCPSCSG